MAHEHAQLFESLRQDVLARLLEVRGSIDDAYAKIPETLIQEHFEIALDKMYTFLATDDASTYRRFISRYMAVRVGEGLTHESIIHGTVAIGDVVAQVARETLAESPMRDQFIRAVMRMNYVHARMLVALVAEDLAERVAQRDRLQRSLL
jgi:predicted nucleotidyltransferase